MRFDIITMFPRICDSYLNESIIKRARIKKFADIRVHDLKKFAKGKHRKVDDRPYAGGAGMVLKAEPIIRAVDAILKTKDKGKKTKIVVLSAKGRQFNQKLAYDWSKKCDRIIFIAGRYEGIDERARIALKAEEISIGPYVLTDGDIAAMVVLSSLVRLIPGVIKFESLREESFGNLTLEIGNSAKRVEYPHYTRPEVFAYNGKKYRVPKVLLSGDHKKIEEWRKRHQKGGTSEILL